MSPPDSKTILLFLKRFRADGSTAERMPKKQVFNRWNEIRSKKRRKSGGQESFYDLLEGAKKGPRYDDVVDLIEAHGFECFDTFLDFFRATTVGDVRVIKQGDRSPSQFGNGGRMNRVDITFLGDHRTKIEIVVLPRGEKTAFHCHSGHEFVWVDEGSVRVKFQDASGGQREEDLATGDSIAFSSLIKHEFTNIGETEAKLVSARPARSRPRDEPSLEWFYSSPMAEV